MGKKKKNVIDKEVAAEYKISMHCNACEKSIAKIISKFKGVEKFTTDMKKHKVVVIGKIDPEMILKKLKKKTGKKVELVVNKEDQKPKEKPSEEDELKAKLELVNKHNQYLFSGCCNNSEVFFIFSDENPNSCCVM